MVEIKRKEFINHDVYSVLHGQLKENHKVPDYAIELFSQNKNVNDFWQQSKHFAFIKAKSPLYMHYIVISRVKDQHIITNIVSISIYDNQAEYEIARVGTLQSARYSDITEAA